MKRYASCLVAVSLLLLVAGCASNLPREIASAPVPDISLTRVQQDIKTYKNKLIRWGGVIISIKNLEQKSTLEILAKPLNPYGRPALNVTSPGRFFAEIPGFVDPSLFAPGREVTVFGSVAVLKTSKIGEHTYQYPVIEVTRYHLWEFISPYSHYDPYWDDWYWGYPRPYLWFSWDYYGHPHPHPHPPFLRRH